MRPISNFERDWRWCRRNPGWASMIGVAISLLLGLIGVLWYDNVKTNALNAKIVEESQLAKKRQRESMLALGLVATEVRNLAEEAMVPPERRAKVLAKLVDELQKQVDDNATDTLDSLRNNSYLCTVLAVAEDEAAREDDQSTWFRVENARSWCAKG